MPAKNESSEKLMRDLGRWRTAKLGDVQAQPEDVSRERRSLYRSGIKDDGITPKRTK